jgi:CRISPR/Cas system CMR-associated protein Cmr1 (group 7 of RAMP superfamily)
MPSYRDIMTMSQQFLSRAEMQVDKLKDDYDKHLPGEISALGQLLRISEVGRAQIILYSMKSTAKSFGWPQISEIADMLWRVLENLPVEKDINKIAFPFYDALDLLVREQREGHDRRGKELVSTLNELKTKYMKAWD